MPYTTMTYPEFNARMGDEEGLQLLPLYTTTHGRDLAGETQVTAYVPISDRFPCDLSVLEQRLRAKWKAVEIVLVTGVPATRIWWGVPT